MCALVVLGMIGLMPMVSAYVYNGHTPGFWGNKNGQALIDAEDLAWLQVAYLVDEYGNAIDPLTKEEFALWLRGGDTTDMAYMLGVQLAAMGLNVHHGFVGPTWDMEIYAPSTLSADADGNANLAAVMVEANHALMDDDFTPAGDQNRPYQEALKNALDNANNNLNWVV